MESQDQKKTTPPAHESHGVHLCHRCGWPFPNPHPSAKHRRAHKRICGTIEGYKLNDSRDHIHSSVSDDENGSDDEDRKTPSPEIEKRITSEISRGGVGGKSNRSDDEVFSDAVNEFSDKNVENVVESDPGTKQQSKIDATAGIIHLPKSPTDSSQTHNLEVLKTETNLLGSAMPIEDIVSSCNSDSVVSSDKKSEGLAVVLDSLNGSAGELSHIKSVNVSDAPKEDGEANVGGNEIQSLMKHQTDVKGNEDSNVDEVSSDVAVTPSKTASEASEVACKLEETDQRPSDSATADQILELKEGEGHELGPMVSLDSLSPEVKSCQHMEVLVNTPQIEPDSSQDRDVGSHSNSVEGCYTNKERNENVHVLSVANDIPVVDYPEIMVESFRDHNEVKSNLPVTLDIGEVNEPVVDDNKDTVYEEKQSSFHSSKSSESIGISSAAAESLALKDNLKQEGGGNQVLVAEVPVEGEADTSELKNKGDEIGSSGVEPNDIPVVDYPEIMVESFRDHNEVKSNLPVTLDIGEVNEPVVDDNIDTVYEEKQSSFHSSKSGESIGISSAAAESLALKDNLKQEGGGNQVLVAEVAFEGEADTSELKNKGDEIGSSGLELPPVTTTSGEIQTDSHLDGQKPHEIPTDSSEDMLVESTKRGLLDVIPVAISAADELSDKTSINGGNNIHNNDKDQTEKCETDRKDVSKVVKEELSIELERTSESVDGLAVAKADQTANLPGAGNCHDREKSGIEFSDLAGNESRDVAVADVQEKTEINSKMILESACNSSESEAVYNGMDKVMKNLQETATTTNLVSDSSEVTPDASHWGIKAPTQSGSEIQKGEDSQEARKETKFNEVLAESANPACMGAESNHNSGAEVSEKILENPPEHLPVEPGSTPNGSATVENNHCRGNGLGTSGISTEYLQEKGDENLTKQPSEVPAVDVSVDSSSQTDSLEGNWGSVSGAVLSTLSDAMASEAPAQSEKVNLQKPKASSAGHRSNKSDVFEPPSFMTLVEPGGGNDEKAASSDIQTEQNTQQPKSEALQAGWFPSLTNVVNESQGRKKNEEIIAKVANWSAGKQHHTNLKSLLGEASLQTKPKSPNPKQTPALAKTDESTITSNAIPVPKAHANQVSKKEMGREWNSPARYPSEDKKEKRKVKGRAYWVPFVCCSSVN